MTCDLCKLKDEKIEILKEMIDNLKKENEIYKEYKQTVEEFLYSRGILK